MPRFIEIHRRFRDLTEAELDEPEVLAQNEHKYSSPTGWTELLKSERILLLAEAGSGKTLEMKEQVRQLNADGKTAYFLELASLARESLTEQLSTTQEASFQAWKDNRIGPAWFFLDAVDELKLTMGKLDQALNRLGKALGGDFTQVRAIISCRPNDWRPELDRRMMEDLLPIPSKPQLTNPLSDDERFLEPLRANRNGSPVKSPEKEVAPSRTVILLPMSSQQVGVFAESSSLPDAQAFLNEINRQNAWTFARRPQDLIELIAMWKSAGKLGTRTEQHEANITAKLRDDPERPDRDLLSADKARSGAERLALALTLTRTRTIRSPEQSLDQGRAEGVLDPSAILTDWTEAERGALLRRALFDPATYGRVRFHHRSVQEYLSAAKLRDLSRRGMSVKALFRLIFDEHYGENIVIPSMRPIAAWLSLWNDAVRGELTRRQPEVLLSYGDPESLSIGARRELLRSFVSHYGEGGWRGFRISLDDARRIAHPDLADTIRELWGNEPANEDVRDLLIDLIWQGPIEACCDLALQAALNPLWYHAHRLSAVRALIACHQSESLKKIKHGILTQPVNWPDKLVCNLAPRLFPDSLSVDELVQLIARNKEPKDSYAGFSQAFRKIAQSLPPGSEETIDLRNKVADLIATNYRENVEIYRIRSKFNHLTAGLAILCQRQLRENDYEPDEAMIRVCMVASRFGNDETLMKEAIDGLRAQFQSHTKFREIAFWMELEFMDSAAPSEVVHERLFRVEYACLIGPLTHLDRPWLNGGLRSQNSFSKRSVALRVLLRFWSLCGGQSTELEEIRVAIKDELSLQNALTDWTTPPKPDAELEKLERESKQWQRDAKARETRRLKDWKDWRTNLLADPASAFTEKSQLTSVSNIYKYFEISDSSDNRSAPWDTAAIEQAFGSEATLLATTAVKNIWRNTQPTFWSARSKDETGTPDVWIYGLCGVSVESKIPSWISKLSPCEVKVAASYAMVEINGLAPFINALVRDQPAAVDEVLGSELEAQLKLGGTFGHLPLLQDLTHADMALKRLLSPRLIRALLGFPDVVPAEHVAHWRHNLEEIFSILGDSTNDTEQKQLAGECARRHQAGLSTPLGLVWLRGLFRFDTELALMEFAHRLGAATDPSEVFAWFASIFGGRSSAIFRNSHSPANAGVLAAVVRLAYSHVRPEHDQVHEGSYSPDTRDEAERGRSFLLSALLDTPGPEAYREILHLANEQDFAGLQDRLRMLAKKRAATDSELAAFQPAEVVTLESRYELPPHDRDTLFRVMMDRLDDLAHDIAVHDFTDRRTLRTIHDEAEMQRALALKLQAKANGAYTVIREDEVADQKETDIRLCAVKGGHKSVIEIKLADHRWSISDFERALEHQLVGQYLRHETCKAGCLLLTYNGEKAYWQHPTTKTPLNFSALIGYLNQKAKDLELIARDGIRLRVYGLDLTDPPLEPAHRKSLKTGPKS